MKKESNKFDVNIVTLIWVALILASVTYLQPYTQGMNLWQSIVVGALALVGGLGAWYGVKWLYQTITGRRTF